MKTPVSILGPSFKNSLIGLCNLVRRDKSSYRAFSELMRNINVTGNDRRKLTEALRWRALAYGIISKGDKKADEIMRTRLLGGMMAIFQVIEENLPSTSFGDFLDPHQIQRLFSPMKQLADMIHIGFMTGIYELHTEDPGAPYDSSRMEAWNSECIQTEAGGGRIVACTLELGLRKRIERFSAEAHQAREGEGDFQWSVLLKPIVLM